MRSTLLIGMGGLLGLATPPSHSHVLRWVMRFGGMGLFGVSFLDASIIPLPIPGSTDLLLLAMVVRGANPWLMTLAAAAGSIVGGYFTWRTGAKGEEVALKRHLPARYIDRPSRWVKAHGVVAVAVASLLPPPVPLLPFVLAAGALGVPRSKFLLSFGAARTARYAFVAWMGVVYGGRIESLWSTYLAPWSQVIVWTVVGLFAAGILFGIWKFRRQRRATA